MIIECSFFATAVQFKKISQGKERQIFDNWLLAYARMLKVTFAGKLFLW